MGNPSFPTKRSAMVKPARIRGPIPVPRGLNTRRKPGSHTSMKAELPGGGLIRASEKTGAKSAFPKGVQLRRQRDSSGPIIGGPETIASLKEDSRVPNGPAVSSGNISSSDSLKGHPDLIQKPQLFTPKASRDENRHKISIALTEQRGIREIFSDDDRGGRRDELPKGAVPGWCDVS
jgi:hypothetical protein